MKSSVSTVVRRILIAVLALAAIGGTMVAAGCGSSDSDGGEGQKVNAVATTTQVADFVSQVGGEQVELTRILQPNTDPHEYEPRPSDVQAFADADIVFSSGDGIDDWVTQLVDDSGSDATVVDLSDGLPVTREGNEDEGGVDPHWWHDPTNVEAATRTIAASLAEADPGVRKAFRANEASYLKTVRELDHSIAACLDAIPASERRMVTDHDAFGYFADRYGIDVVGTVIPSLSTEGQPSAGDLADLEQAIRDEDVKAVFPESSVPRDLSDAVARDTGASTDYVIYGDTLGPADSDASTWAGMMRSNANSLKKGLTGGKAGCDF